MRKIRKKFKRPKVSWNTDSIKENKALSAEYGLRRTKEILISHEILRGFRQRARQLIAQPNEEREKTLMTRLARLGLLVGKDKELDDVLALTVRNVLDRRLQTIVYRKGVATSSNHARQMIVHGHVRIKGRVIKFPSYLVPADEEASIEIASTKPKPKKPKPVEKHDAVPGTAPISKPNAAQEGTAVQKDKGPGPGKAGSEQEPEKAETDINGKEKPKEDGS